MATKAKHKEDFEQRLNAEGTGEDGGISTKQALIYLAVVVACFCVLYPKIIHPMVISGLGLNEKKSAPANEVPPQLRMPGAPIPGRPGPGSRPPPAAAARERIAGETADKGGKGGSGGIMMSLILPVYAFGIMGYLLYTASKVYGGGKDKGGKNKKKKKHDEIYDLITSRLSSINLEGVLSGTDLKGAEEINKLADYLRKKHYGEETDEVRETLIEQENTTGDNRESSNDQSKTTPASKMSEAEVLKLQQKLANMESEMARLMSTMKQNQSTNEQTTENVSTNEQTTENVSTNEQTTENVSTNEQSRETISTNQKSPVKSKPDVKIDMEDEKDGCEEGDVDREADHLDSEASSGDTEELLQELENVDKILYEHMPGSSDEESLDSDDEDLVSDEDDVECLGQFDAEAGSSVRRRNLQLEDSDDPDDY